MFALPWNTVVGAALWVQVVASAVLTERSVPVPVPASQTSCNKKTYSYVELAGFGWTPSDIRDQYGDTMGSFGGIALDQTQWKKLDDGTYTGLLWALTDRGWNSNGTISNQARIQQFSLQFNPKVTASATTGPGNLVLQYVSSLLLYGPDGTTPTTGLDADPTAYLSFPGFPNLPTATLTYDIFGAYPAGTKMIAIDGEGLALGADGSFWVSDEYGPYIYQFNSNGVMINAIRPPDAYIPMRNGTDSFSSDSPPRMPDIGLAAAHDVYPYNNPTGRHNNQGFKGLTVTRDGNSLFAMLQAATNQEGGMSHETESYTRLLKYDITNKHAPRYAREFVVPLPLYTDPVTGNKIVATQTEVLNIKDGQFFVLARDSGAGAAKSRATSVYRHVDIFDLEDATDIKNANYDCKTCSIASASGKLKNSITPAKYCSFLDFNINNQLNRFGFTNGPPTSSLSSMPEKWDGLAMVPVDGKKGDDDQWFLFSMSKSDMITQNGFIEFGTTQYKDPSSYNVGSTMLVFKIKLPQHS